MATGIPDSMKALVKEQEGVSYTYKDVPVPRPQGDELLVKVSKVALCGTDISKYKWNAGELATRHSRTTDIPPVYCLLQLLKK